MFRKVSDSKWVFHLERWLDNLVLNLPSSIFIKGNPNRLPLRFKCKLASIEDIRDLLSSRFNKDSLVRSLGNTYVLLAFLASFHLLYLVLVISIWSFISPMLPVILRLLLGLLYTMLSLWILPQVFVDIFFPILNREIDEVMDRLNRDRKVNENIRINSHNIKDDGELKEGNWSSYLPGRFKFLRNMTTRSLRRRAKSQSLVMDTHESLRNIIIYLINSKMVHINDINILDSNDEVKDQVRYAYIKNPKSNTYFVLDVNSRHYFTYLKWVGMLHLFKDWNFRRYMLGKRVYLNWFVFPSLYSYLGFGRIFLPKDNNPNFNRYYDQYGNVWMDIAPAFPTLIPVINMANDIVGKIFRKKRDLLSQKEGQTKPSLMLNKVILDYGILIILLWFVMNLIFWLLDKNRDYENRSEDLIWRSELKIMLVNVAKFVSFLIITCMMLLIWYAL